MPSTPSIRIKEKALELGFTDCGIAKAEHLFEDEKRLQQWLDEDMHGEMHYMANHFEKRTDPRKLVEGTKSVVSLILNYYPEEKIEPADTPVISKYAYGEDYHFVMKRMMRELMEYINNEILPIEGRAFVDTAPVLDRAWAARAGLGWIGKNANLISPKHGSFVFIGSLMLNVELEYDVPLQDFCGGCTKCLRACPTGAIVAPKVIDGRRCISYLTIEYRGENIPEEYSDKMQNYVFGCDICQDVCPWNRKTKPTEVNEFHPRDLLKELYLQKWGDFTREKYQATFKKSAVKRAKYQGLTRNLRFIQSGDSD